MLWQCEIESKTESDDSRDCAAIIWAEPVAITVSGLMGLHKTDFPQPPRGYSIPTNLLEFEIAAHGDISKSSIQLAVDDKLELYK